MWLGIITLFPDMFAAVSREGVFGRAVASEIVSLEFFNPRDYTTDRHRTVDDRPYGGGAGMVMKVEPLQQAVAAAKSGRFCCRRRSRRRCSLCYAQIPTWHVSCAGGTC